MPPTGVREQGLPECPRPLSGTEEPPQHCMPASASPSQDTETHLGLPKTLGTGPNPQGVGVAAHLLEVSQGTVAALKAAGCHGLEMPCNVVWLRLRALAHLSTSQETPPRVRATGTPSTVPRQHSLHRLLLAHYHLTHKLSASSCEDAPFWAQRDGPPALGVCAAGPASAGEATPEWQRGGDSTGSGTHRVLEGQEAVAYPTAGGAIAADVGEGLVQVAVRCTE